MHMHFSKGRTAAAGINGHPGYGCCREIRPVLFVPAPGRSLGLETEAGLIRSDGCQNSFSAVENEVLQKSTPAVWLALLPFFFRIQTSVLKEFLLN